MTISGNQKLISTIESPLEDFEPMPEGDKQRRNLSYATEALRLWFEQTSDVYVSGNLFIRYEENGVEKRIAPDIFVVFGTSKEDRVSYTVWEEEGKAPDFVLEITSKGTVAKDREENPLIYEALGIKEYFQYDPTGEYLKPASLQGVRLENGKYVALASSTLTDGTLSLHSEVLGLDLHLFPDLSFRFYDPISNQILRSHAEAEHARFQAELERSFEQQARLEAEAIVEQERNEKLKERQEKERLAAYLRSMGINPDEI
ncbi:Uma2 family endonuclease [Tumidithrix elongata RA019]|uniref:Uma2 family endonuclease n=1 Tax=Tumidithrix elongata BACA0141 TaxID=2716417 RepID=A0AAW9QBV5_9CYAN|nr:Uma2 family endonuclease [Tumidithrix elongata RA019]